MSKVCPILAAGWLARNDLPDESQLESGETKPLPECLGEKCQAWNEGYIGSSPSGRCRLMQ